MNQERIHIDTVARLKGTYAAVRVEVDVGIVRGVLCADARATNVTALAEPLTREELEVEILRRRLADAERNLPPVEAQVQQPETPKVRPLAGTDKMFLTIYETYGNPAEVMVHPGSDQAVELVESGVNGAIGLTREFLKSHIRELEDRRRTYDKQVREGERLRDLAFERRVQHLTLRAHTALLNVNHTFQHDANSKVSKQ